MLAFGGIYDWVGLVKDGFGRGKFRFWDFIGALIED